MREGGKNKGKRKKENIEKVSAIFSLIPQMLPWSRQHSWEGEKSDSVNGGLICVGVCVGGGGVHGVESSKMGTQLTKEIKLFTIVFLLYLHITRMFSRGF
jgi:hypothetical protein